MNRSPGRRLWEKALRLLTSEAPRGAGRSERAGISIALGSLALIWGGYPVNFSGLNSETRNRPDESAKD